MTFQTLMIIVGSVVGYAVIRTYGGDVLAWFAVRRSVSRSQVVMSRANLEQAQTNLQTTDRRADRPSVCAVSEGPARLQLDRTRGALIEELLTLGWTITDFRREQIFRGDNNKISAEVDAARKRLGMESDDRQAISPVAGRPIPPGVSFHSDSPELEYSPPD